jgi:hypothetical protein
MKKLGESPTFFSGNWLHVYYALYPSSKLAGIFPFIEFGFESNQQP